MSDKKQEIQDNIPWQIYPRPQMKRDSFLCLNGEWDFTISKDADRPLAFDRKILVPFAPESEASGLSLHHEVGEWLHYRLRFSLPDGFVSGGEVLLHFGAVDQIARVTLNGRLLSEHEGGYLPFSLSVKETLEEQNELWVAVRDDLDHSYPWGKQKRDRGGMWYTPVSGIWQTVWMEALPEGAIRSLRIEQTLENATLTFESDAPVLRVVLEDGTVVPVTDNRVTIVPKQIHPWSPEHPYLYTFRAETESDTVESYFALREIAIGTVGEHPRILLNGEPYFFHAMLDQGYYRDGIYLPSTPERMEADILFAKQMGFNTLRKHIKIEPMVFYHWCDLHGVVVFQDFVNNGDYSFLRDTALPTVGLKRLCDRLLHRDPVTRERFLKAADETVAHLYNCPSVLYYTVFNEGWGQFDADSAYERYRAADPSRIFDATSGWFKRSKSDVRSEHVYFKKLKQGRSDGRPFVVSEFGGYSLRIADHTFRKENYGYKLFQTEKELTDALVALYENEVIPLVGKGLCASVLTQLSDVEDETNGLITYDREYIKVDEGRMRNVSDALTRAIKKTAQ